MICPECGAHSEVIDSRPAPHSSVRRRRHCTLGHKFTTYEIPAGDVAQEVSGRVSVRFRMKQGRLVTGFECEECQEEDA